MDLNRRHLLTAAATSAAAFAAPLSAFGLDATQFGVHPGVAGDQSAALQRAIDQAARTRVPLMLAPGVYRAGGLTLPAGASLAGVRGATRLILTHGPSLVSAAHAETVSLTGLTFDGGGQPLPAGRALMHFDDVKAIRVSDCEVAVAGGNAVMLENCDGEVTHNTITGAGQRAVLQRQPRPADRHQHHRQIRQRRHPGLAKRQAPRRQPDRRQSHRGYGSARRRKR